MKTIALATAVALISVGPALARPAHVRMSHHVPVPHSSLAAPDPYGAYVGGQEVGRDPDPNIRATIRDEDYVEQHGG